MRRFRVGLFRDGKPIKGEEINGANGLSLRVELRYAGRTIATADWLHAHDPEREAPYFDVHPVLLSADIAKKEEALKRFAQPILARPKPAPPPPAPEATPESAPEAEPSASEPMDAEGAEEAPKPAADDLD